MKFEGKKYFNQNTLTAAVESMIDLIEWIDFLFEFSLYNKSMGKIRINNQEM